MPNPVEDFLKEAGLWDALKHGVTFGNAENLAKAVGKNPNAVTGAERVVHRAGQMAGNAGVATALYGGAKMIDHAGDAIAGAVTGGAQHRAEHEAMLAAHPSLQGEDPQEVEMVLRSIRNLAPSLSADPLVAGSLVRNVLAYGRTEQGLTMPPETAKMLAETHSKLVGKGSGTPSLLDTFNKQLVPVKGEGGPKMPDIQVNTMDPGYERHVQHFDEGGHPTSSELHTYERR